jgi:hypothetical protein
MPFHIFSGKGRAPAKNGAQTVFQAHISEDKSLFLMNQHDQADEPVKAAANKKNKGQPS